MAVLVTESSNQWNSELTVYNNLLKRISVLCNIDIDC